DRTHSGSSAGQTLSQLVAVANAWSEYALHCRLSVDEPQSEVRPPTNPIDDIAAQQPTASNGTRFAQRVPSESTEVDDRTEPDVVSDQVISDDEPAMTLDRWLSEQNASGSSSAAEKNHLLCVAAGEGFLDAVAWLLEQGARPEAPDADKRTAMHHASGAGSVPIVNLLTSLGCSVKTEDASKLTPLHLAAERGHAAVVDILIGRGADVNAGDEYKRTPLHQALKHGHLAVAARLVAAGATVNAKNAFNSAPLHIAAKMGRADVVDWLLNSSVSARRRSIVELTAFDDFDRTPLHHACEGGHINVVRLIVEHCERSQRDTAAAAAVSGHASPHPAVGGMSHIVGLRNKKEKFSPLHLAARYGHLPVVQYLVDHAHVGVNAADNRQLSTPLHLALRNGQGDVVRFLLGHGADPNARDAAGLTPLDVARAEGRAEEVAAWLNGTEPNGA
ncbi:hypothetical protein HK405_005973, partial [Cladochytrium tenue]